ncbi:hypothetical protein PAAG_03879 [Paracoccidioides lutzii Pb01]|uniref:Uncharacterized protein n=1 Tax=Paracoccidioides lutzii (strain ATCC MYA-826 / Pb01) TaxID=502779 RepID=C1GZD5_PARBA|nr:hypothetical protein PAAG_03879 [Paracoccidioides lutzii Pb01]EEH41958.2 hypothetical protein PAAG_03879 [Paracoccidioides lutzii Pb01]
MANFLTEISSVTISLAMLRDLLPLTSDSQIGQHNMISTILEVQMHSSVPASWLLYPIDAVGDVNAGKRAATSDGSTTTRGRCQSLPGPTQPRLSSGGKNRVMTLRQAEADRYILLDSGLKPICLQDEAVGVNLCPIELGLCKTPIHEIC